MSDLLANRPRDTLRAPSDWPGPGPIDLARHDLPHESSTTEWWYMNAHVVADDGGRYSLFAAFFRQAMGKDATTGAVEYAHSVTWAIADLDNERYFHFSGVDPSAPEHGLKRIRRGLGSTDNRLNRSLGEILERGNVPKPDQLLRGGISIATDRLDLNYSGHCFTKQVDGTYRLELSDPGRKIGCNIVFRPLKPPTRHGDDGVVRGAENEAMFYYFIPRCAVTGTVRAGGDELGISQGQGWYDHEFGTKHRELTADPENDPADPKLRELVHTERRVERDRNAIGWDWLSAQLDDGTDLTVYPLTYVRSNEPAGAWAIVVDAEGRRTSHDDLSFEPIERWQSTQTFFEHPVRWRCRIPSANIDLDVKAAFHDQEFITLISKPSFWEGRVDVSGTHNGKAVTGPGFVERSGFAPFEDLDGFFEAVGRVVRKSVREVIPLEPTIDEAIALVGSSDRPHYIEGLDIAQYARTMIKPIREITDRGGKGWRSYAAITCCDIVGGDSREFVQWLALPEMMHVGSLIVDDVQDKSEVRRGGPTAHLLYGEAQSINSGTAAYFIGQTLLTAVKLPDRDRLKIYNLYFEALRAGHAGQAIDLDGFEKLLPKVVESGNAWDLEQRVLAVHRLKTAAPAGALARMGAIAGRGTPEQVEGLGQFFEALGLAFQIIDDVLNLRGFKGDLKAKAEDVTQGKATLPVAKALSRLDLEKRRWLVDTLATKPSDPDTVGAVVQTLEDCGAVSACADQAKQLVEDAWQRLNPLVEDTLAKMMLRAFSWFVLERHY